MNAYFLAGPTAVGKTAVAHILARKLELPILSTDSMLVYEGMNIGTAKPSPEERDGITYYGLDLVTPDTTFNTGDYLRAVQDCCSACIATGGTGLYIKALCNGLDDLPPGDPSRRAALEMMDVHQLQDLLQTLDAEWLEALADPLNPRRLVRAIELAEAGIPRPDQRLTKPKPRVVGLDMDRERLRERISQRVDRMYAQGLIDEVRDLRARFPKWSSTAGQAIGYAEALQVLNGESTVQEAKTATVSRTRKYAKRQRTWFNNQFEITWVLIEADNDPEQIADQVLVHWERMGPSKCSSEK